jgi:hypothetical protein
LLPVAVAVAGNWVLAVALAGTGLQPDLRFQLGRQLQSPSALVALVLLQTLKAQAVAILFSGALLPPEVEAVEETIAEEQPGVLAAGQEVERGRLER